MTLNKIEAELIRIAVSDSDEPPHCFGPVPDGRIDQAETELGLRFPPSYRAFLRVYGAGSMHRHDFNGLPTLRNSGPTMPLYGHVVDQTMSTWSYPHPYPRSWIDITGDGGDYTYHIETAIRDERGECPIIVNGPGHGGQVVASDFLDFLRKLARGETMF